MKLDHKRFWPVIIIIGFVLLLVCVNLEAVQAAVSSVYDSISASFGWFYVLVGIAALVFSIWIAFSRFGKVRLGGADAKPEYSNFAWTAMMLTTCCSAGILVMGFIESVSYVATPPWHAEPFSVQAYEYVGMYTHHHWGFVINALFVPSTVALCYLVHNRRKKVVAMSSVLEPVIGNGNGVVGHIVDIVATVGAIMAPIPSMGMGMPLLTRLSQEVFGFSDSFLPTLQIIILVLWILMFSTSVYLGLDKGIKNLSNTNVILALIFMLIAGILAGPVHVLQTAVHSLGLYLGNFIQIITNTDPFGDGAFFQNWTVWAIAWAAVYVPMMGIFNAKISKGRTLREVVIAQVVGVSVGSWVVPMTLGNYTLNLQRSGTLDVASILAEKGQPEAIVTILNTMPFAKIMTVLTIILAFVFMATTVDSSAFVAAETTTRHLSPDDRAPRWCRLIWAVVGACVTLVLLKVGGFTAVQLLAIIMGLPMCLLLLIAILVVIRMLRQDEKSELLK